jgi:hypothetical protein
MIGIISDTHDNLPAIDAAVDMLNERGVSLVLHAGDYVAPFTVPRFGRLNARLRGVYGNNDGEKRGLEEKFRAIGAEVSNFLELVHEDLRICVYHGTIRGIVDALISSGKYDVVISGHSHSPGTKRVNGVWWVNPGEVCGYLTGKRTIALLDEGSPVIEEF